MKAPIWHNPSPIFMCAGYRSYDNWRKIKENFPFHASKHIDKSQNLHYLSNRWRSKTIWIQKRKTTDQGPHACEIKLRFKVHNLGCPCALYHLVQAQICMKVTPIFALLISRFQFCLLVSNLSKLITNYCICLIYIIKSLHHIKNQFPTFKESYPRLIDSPFRSKFNLTPLSI